MSSGSKLDRPRLAPHVRFRWDPRRQEHQLVFPEGLWRLNATAAVIARYCDGRTRAELVQAVADQFVDGAVEAEIAQFLEQLAQRGFLVDAHGP